MNAWRSLWIGIMAAALPAMIAAGGGVAPEFVQDAYRWRNDDGGENAGGASWKADADTPIGGVQRDKNIRLRFSVRQDALMTDRDGNPTTCEFDAVIQYATNTDGPWNDVATAGDAAAFVMGSTTWYANGAPTTDQLGSGGAFLPGKCVEAPTNISEQVTGIYLNYLNVEWCLRATANALRNQTYYFRMADTSGIGNNEFTYTKYARLTMEDTDCTNLPAIVSSLAPQDLTVGIAWSYTILATGLRPIQYVAQGLPAGIALSSNVLSGVPTEGGIFPVTLTVSNVMGATAEVLTLNVATQPCLLVGQNEIQVALSTGGTTTVSLNLTNPGPGDAEWAIHIQGGTAPGGSAGAIDRTLAIPRFVDQYGSTRTDMLRGAITYRARGTADTADDEIWIKDWSGESVFGYYNTIHRRSVSDWRSLGAFTDSGHSIESYCQFDPSGDRYWTLNLSSHCLVNVATATEVRRISLSGVPGSGLYAAHPEEGVIYSCIRSADSSEISLWQSRSADGRLIAAHGRIPSLVSVLGISPYGTQYGRTCWKDGYLWCYRVGNAGTQTARLWRWTPGMEDAVEGVVFSTGNTFTTGGGTTDYVGICPAAEAGFVWVFTHEDVAPYAFMRHVDTGWRPWLRLAAQHGTLTNGASQSLTVQIDATTAPTGTYHAVLAITQYPNVLIPQILVPVTLTVTSGGAPLDADADGMPDAWENTYLGGTNASPTEDEDSDGMSNFSEFKAGTFPNESESVLAMVGLTGSGQNLDLKWLSVDGKKYDIQKSTNLTEGFPVTEASGIEATPPENTHTVSPGGVGVWFYRVRVE